LQGDTAEARAAYHGFLILWKDADSDIPMLKDAKQTLASMRQQWLAPANSNDASDCARPCK